MCLSCDRPSWVCHCSFNMCHRWGRLYRLIYAQCLWSNDAPSLRHYNDASFESETFINLLPAATDCLFVSRHSNLLSANLLWETRNKNLFGLRKERRPAGCLMEIKQYIITYAAVLLYEDQDLVKPWLLSLCRSVKGSVALCWSRRKNWLKAR